MHVGDAHTLSQLRRFADRDFRRVVLFAVFENERESEGLALAVRATAGAAAAAAEARSPRGQGSLMYASDTDISAKEFALN